MATTRLRGSPEEQITAAIEAFQDGWNRHDLEACFSSFAEDADFVNVVGKWWRGRHEIVRDLQALHQDRFRDSTVSATSVSIRFLRSDVAVVHAGWEMRGDRGPDGRGVPLRKGILTLMMSRPKGRWIVDAVQNSDLIVTSIGKE